MIESEAQVASPKSRRRWLQYGLRCLLFLMLAPSLFMVVMAIIEGVVGYSRSGFAPTLGDLPEIGSALKGCEVEGRVAYQFYRHPHGTYNYFLCGHALPRQIDGLCERLRLSSHALDNGDERDLLNSEIRETAQVAGLEKYWKGPFQIGDVILLLGTQSKGGYRRSDGWFSLHLIFARPLEVVGEQEHTR